MVAQIQEGGSGDEVSSAIRAKIATHPLYPKLLHAYIKCQKVGAPSEFMETSCDVLVKYKSDLTRPFDEATTFLNNIETQLNILCNGVSRSYVSDKATGSLEEAEGGKLKTWKSTRSVAFTNEILSKKRCLN
ncbi:hypothetical protein AAG906_011624 [Vitis piasezkii]